MQREQGETEPEVGAENQQNKQLINEAIKRILLDIVIRGHGDRLIGRWSREPQIQAFLERVPYLLDRVNQLHLACTRPDQTADVGTSNGHHHHHRHHHHHHHHHHQHHLQTDTHNSSLHEFVNLIGVEQLDSNAWLVRTRDSLGLTPIHKAVLFHNRPVCEFILDRYPDELAAPSSSRANHSGPNQTAARLIDAQDKYGRTALHYAAASANDNPDKQTGDLFKLLILRGASTKICDFRGKTPAYYKDHPNQLRAKSIIHLANKLNANYQANVLSRTLRAMAFRESNDLLGSDDERDGRWDRPQGWHSAGANQRRPAQPGDNRESMSMSCADLSNPHSGEMGRRSSQSLINLNQDEQLYGHLDDMIQTECDQSDSKPQLEAPTFESASLRSSLDVESNDTNDAVHSIKSLIKERSSRLILSEKTRLRIRRQLIEGKVDQINELLIEGFGQQLLIEAPVTCWNQQCRQYVLKVVPGLLKQLDTLHEFIATNQFDSMRRLLEQSHPILVRMRRPYRRAAMNSLHLAVHQNRRSIVMFLLERYPELINQLDSNGATCLHWAAKALHNDRLYAWLTEHFGAQLESLRDDRGKTAANYRQQTIRMNSVDDRELEHDAKPNRDTSSLIQSKQQRIERKNFGVIMRKQHENEKQLEVKGASERLVRRPAGRRKHETPPSRSNRAEAEENQAAPDQIQVRIGVESPSTLDSTCSRDESIGSKSDSKLTEGKKQSAESQPGVEQDREQKSEWLSSGQDDEQVERSRLLADELVQLDVHEDDIEPGRAKSLTDDDKKEPDTKSSSNSIEQIIRKCIVTGDLMKLEHLILAGCGQRVTRVYEELKSAHSDATLVNDRTRDFIERRSIELMQTIERIHEILHQCYSHATTIGDRPNSACQTINLTQSSSDQPVHNANGRSSKNGAQTNLEASSKPLAAVMNSKFHKMCSLLSSNWLVMARDKFGACPLHVALLRSDRRLLDYLLRRYPNAAGAPDHDSRNALHYAAIVLAAFERHGSMRLVKMTADSTSDGMQSNSMGVARPHWLVDATSRLLYENLCARYSHELSEARDKFGKTHQDYLQSSKRTSEVRHAKLDELPAGLHEARVIENCCEQYAVMLSRYQYAIWLKTDPDRLELVANVDEKQEPGEDDGKPEGENTRESSGQMEFSGRLVDPNSGSLVESHQSAAPSDGRHSPEQTDRTEPDALIGDESTSLSPLNAWESAPAQDDRHHQHRSRNHRRGATSARHSIVGGVIVPTIIHNDKMDEIETYDIIYRQPQQSSRASSSSPSSCSSCSSASCSSASSLSSSSISLDDLNQNDSHHRHHHKQMTVDDQHLSKQLTKTLNQRSPLSSGHKHHRKRSNHDHRQRHHHNRSRASNEKLQSLLPGAPELVPAGPSGAPDDDEAKTFGKNVTARVNSPSSSSSDEDDERVERLSNEFENRVRREKNELRAKVDQIMREIKMSARSRKSSRFLSSPNDLMALNSISLIGVDGIGALNNHKTGAPDTKHKSSTASTSSKNTTISDSSRTSPSNASSSSRCSSSKVGSIPLGPSRKSRNSSNSSVSTTASSLSTASSPVAAKTVTSIERANLQQPSAAQANQGLGRGQRLLPANTNPHHLSELTDQLVSKNSYGQTYLHFIASRSQNSSTFYRVLEHSNHLIAERDVFYRTARDVALQFNLLNNVQLLDKFVIDLFVQGRMQLLWALLKQGYSPLIHVADADGNDIMLILKLLKRDSMICCLLQMADFQRWRDELHTYIRNNYISGAIELIRDHRELVKAKSAYSRTSLHLAVLFDRIEMVDELIAIDPTSVHAVDNMGRTPLHYAFGLNLKNGDSIREKLISSGSQADFRDVRQRTAKYYYIFKREIEEIRRVEMDIN